MRMTSGTARPAYILASETLHDYSLGFASLLTALAMLVITAHLALSDPLGSQFGVMPPLLSGIGKTSLPDHSQVKPVVDPQTWREMHLQTPQVIRQARIPDYQFTYQGAIPALKIEGATLDFMLPRAVWVKLEHPGQAFLYIDTDAGLFVRPLDEATPGFASRCNLGAYGYANTDGDAVRLDTAALKLHALWVVQDARAEAGHAPGWVALDPPPHPALIAQK